jgi:DNA-binding MarR family transcriptional regulator
MEGAKQSDGQPLVRTVGKEVIADIGNTCVLMRTRLISRVITGIYDEKLRPFGIGSAQFALLVVIYQIEPATRAKIGRFHHQHRSILTRNLKVILSEGWAEEVRYQTDARSRPDGRSRPIALTKAGIDLLLKAEPAWQAAQAQAKALLGKDGTIAVMDIANRMIGSTR